MTAFSTKERAAIEAFFGFAGRKPETTPASAFKAGDLLASGLRPRPLPSDLKSALPDLPANMTRLIVDQDILLVDRNTHKIVDVIPAVVAY